MPVFLLRLIKPDHMLVHEYPLEQIEKKEYFKRY